MALRLQDDPDRRPLTLAAYRALTRAAAPAAPLFLAWRERRGKEEAARRGERLGRAGRERPAGPLAWFHAASVGEANAVLPLIGALRERRPGLNVLLTTGTVTSARLAAARAGEGIVHQYAPLDAPAFARRFLDHWRPAVAVFAESEIWPNLIGETARRGIPLALVNGRLSRRTYGQWRRRPATSRALFARFDLVLAQNGAHAGRLAQLGAAGARAVGNLKIDAPAPAADPGELEALKEASRGRAVFLAASTHPGEEAIVLEAHALLARRRPELLTILVPRHPRRGAEVAALARAAGLETARRSDGGIPDGGAAVYVADTIGELGLFYALAPVAFIGGSLVPHGGQNPVEAIRHRAAVLAGPHVRNFSDAYDALATAGGIAAVASAAELAERADELLGDETARARMLEAGETAVAGLGGALEKTLAALDGLLPPPAETEKSHAG